MYEKKLIGLIREGTLEEIREIIKLGAPVDARDWEEKTALHWAIFYRREDVAVALLELGADPMGESGETDESEGKFPTLPISIAARNGLAGVTAKLLELGVDIKTKDHTGKPPLWLAAEYGNLELFNFLCRNGADLNFRTPKNSSILHAACLGGNPEIIKSMLKTGATFDEANEYGFTPLHFLAEKGHETLFIENIGSVDCHAINAKQPLIHIAVESSSPGIVRWLHEAGFDVNSKNDRGKSALDCVSFACTALELIKCGGQIKNRECADTLLILALEDDSPELVQAVNEASFDVTKIKGDEQYAEYAVINVAAKVCSYLHKQKKAFASFENFEKVQLLYSACKIKFPRMAQRYKWLHPEETLTLDTLVSFSLEIYNQMIMTLISAGCRPDAVDGSGLTPLHQLTSFHSADSKDIEEALGKPVSWNTGDLIAYLDEDGRFAALLKLLVDNGGDINAVYYAGTSPLIKLADENMAKSVEKVLAMGAEIDIESESDGAWTALRYAIRSGSSDAAEVLIRSGADLFCYSSYDGKQPLDGLSDCDAWQNIVTLLERLRAEGVIVFDSEQQEEVQKRLHEAAEKSQAHMIEAWTRLGASLEKEASDGFYEDMLPLHAAVLEYASEQNSESLETIRKIIELGVNIDQRSKWGSTALHIASANNAVPAAQLLLELGADINLHDAEGNTPLHNAWGRESREMIDLFLKEGADSKAVNVEGKTPEGHKGQGRRIVSVSWEESE